MRLHILIIVVVVVVAAVVIIIIFGAVTEGSLFTVQLCELSDGE